MENVVKKRVEWLDTVKFFAMWMVICGHFIQNGSYHPTPADWKEDPVFLFIYSFHMPLFVMLSGIFFSSALKSGFKVIAIRKFRQLMIPGYVVNFVLVIIGFLITMCCGDNSVKLHNSLIVPFWFLFVIYVSYIVCWGSLKILKNKYVAAAVSCLIFFVIPGGSYNIFNSFLPYFWCGYLLKDVFLQSHTKLDICLLLCSVIAFVVLYPFWNFECTVYELPIKISNILVLGGANCAKIITWACW